ncbi:hypothetical protein KJZ61_03935 [Candidatus Dependentiae bacterium]|nr:hypothetical protein [Candidatus Dependentiae bacterium]
MLHFFADKQARATTMLFQIIFITISATILFFLLVRAVNTFVSLDEHPEQHALTPDKIKQFGQSSALVTVGLFIRNFPRFNPQKNEFDVDGTLSFEFDPSIVSLETLSKFSFERGTIDKKSEPKIRSLHTNKLFVQYDLRVQFTSGLREDYFPFNGHSIFITLINQHVSPGEVMFHAPPTTYHVSDNLQTPGWTLHSHNVRTGYSISRIDSLDSSKDSFHPQVIFQLDFRRDGMRQILLILLPIIVIFYALVASLGIDPETLKTVIISISIGSLTAILAYRFVIESLSPQVGYFMTADLIYFVILGATFILFFINLITDLISARIKELITISIHTFVLLSVMYLLHFNT